MTNSTSPRVITHPTRSRLHQIIILGTPLCLAVVELWHPRFSENAFAAVSPIVDQWLLIHLLQLPLFGLLALAVCLLTYQLQGVVAFVSRSAIGIFAIFYTAFDAVVGISTGILVRNAQSLLPNQQATIAYAVEELFYDSIVGDNLSVLATIGGLGWIIGIVTSAIGFWHVGFPRFPLILLALSSIFVSHPRPTGSLGMLFFFSAALWLELFQKRQISIE